MKTRHQVGCPCCCPICDPNFPVSDVVYVSVVAATPGFPYDAAKLGSSICGPFPGDCTCGVGCHQLLRASGTLWGDPDREEMYFEWICIPTGGGGHTVIGRLRFPCGTGTYLTYETSPIAPILAGDYVINCYCYLNTTIPLNGPLSLPDLPTCAITGVPPAVFADFQPVPDPFACCPNSFNVSIFNIGEATCACLCDPGPPCDIEEDGSCADAIYSGQACPESSFGVTAVFQCVGGGHLCQRFDGPYWQWSGNVSSPVYGCRPPNHETWGWSHASLFLQYRDCRNIVTDPDTGISYQLSGWDACIEGGGLAGVMRFAYTGGAELWPGGPRELIQGQLCAMGETLTKCTIDNTAMCDGSTAMASFGGGA